MRYPSGVDSLFFFLPNEADRSSVVYFVLRIEYIAREHKACFCSSRYIASQKKTRLACFELIQRVFAPVGVHFLSPYRRTWLNSSIF